MVPMKIPNDDELKIRIPNASKKTLQAIADREGLKLSDIARRAVREWLSKNAARKS